MLEQSFLETNFTKKKESYNKDTNIPTEYQTKHAFSKDNLYFLKLH